MHTLKWEKYIIVDFDVYECCIWEFCWKRERASEREREREREREKRFWMIVCGGCCLLAERGFFLCLRVPIFFYMFLYTFFACFSTYLWLFFYLFGCMCVLLPVYAFFCLFMHAFLTILHVFNLFVCMYIFVFVCLYVCFSIGFSACFQTCLISTCFCVCSSICLCVCFPSCYECFSISLFVCFSICLCLRFLLSLFVYRYLCRQECNIRSFYCGMCS